MSSFIDHFRANWPTPQFDAFFQARANLRFRPCALHSWARTTNHSSVYIHACAKNRALTIESPRGAQRSKFLNAAKRDVTSFQRVTRLYLTRSLHFVRRALIRLPVMAVINGGRRVADRLRKVLKGWIFYVLQ